MSISFDTIGATLTKVATASEDSLESSLETLGSKENPTTTDILAFSQKVSEWSISMQIDTTMIKEFGDTLKGAIQKVS